MLDIGENLDDISLGVLEQQGAVPPRLITWSFDDFDIITLNFFLALVDSWYGYKKCQLHRCGNFGVLGAIVGAATLSKREQRISNS